MARQVQAPEDGFRQGFRAFTLYLVCGHLSIAGCYAASCCRVVENAKCGRALRRTGRVVPHPHQAIKVPFARGHDRLGRRSSWTSRSLPDVRSRSRSTKRRVRMGVPRPVRASRGHAGAHTPSRRLRLSPARSPLYARRHLSRAFVIKHAGPERAQTLVLQSGNNLPFLWQDGASHAAAVSTIVF
jgi:hypothetical protein